MDTDEQRTMWERLASSPHKEDRDLAEVALALLRSDSLDDVRRSVERGLHPREAAASLTYNTPLFPLTESDQKHLLQAALELESGAYDSFMRRPIRDKRYDRSLKANKPLAVQTKQKILDAYRERLARDRQLAIAHRIGMTINIRAAHASWEALIRDGAIPYAQVRRYWVTARDARCCDRCADIPSMNGDGVAFEEPFRTSKDGEVYAPPLCAFCRCTVWIRRENPVFARSPAPGQDVFKW